MSDGLDLLFDGFGGEAEEGSDLLVFVEDKPAETAHDANLAERLSASDRGRIARELLDLVEGDCRARQRWDKLAAKGRRMLGLSIDDLGQEQAVVEKTAGNRWRGQKDDDWTQTAVHPLLAEAVVRFQAQAQAEINPPAGPAKGLVFGDKTRELEDQADRVARLINWLVTDELPEWQDQSDRLLFVLPVDGEVYTKVMWDADRMIRRLLVRSHDVWLPWHATSFHEASRVTHRMRWCPGRIRELQADGYLLADVVIGPAVSEDRPETERVADRSIGLDPVAAGDDADDRPIEVLEVYTQYDLGLPGEPPGKSPYVFTFLRADEQLVAVRRNWAPDDQRRRPWQLLTQWPFLLGDHGGPYAYGLPHLIGSLSETATVLLRSILRIAAKQADPAGFIQDSILNNPKFDKSPMSAGELRASPATIEDLQKGIFFLPSGDASSLSSVLQFVVDAGQRFASTADLQVGAGDARAPVGTTLAMIEQGSRVYTSIHARLHRSQRRELKTIVGLISAYVDRDATYPFHLSGGPWLIRDDFDERVDVVPVSDPRVSSATQRVAIAQAMHQLASGQPDMYDMRAVHSKMLRAIGISDPDEVLLPDDAAIRRDAVSENMVMLYGRPVLAYYDQNHDAHIDLHTQFFAGLPRDGQQALGPAFTAHMGEHIAFRYRIGVERALAQFSGAPAGALLPPPPLPGPRHAGDDRRDHGPPLPPEIERMVDAAAAAAAQMMGPGGAKHGQDQPDPAMLEVERKARETELKAQRLELDRGKAVADVQMRAEEIKADAALEGQRIDLERQKLELARGKAIADAALRSAEVKDTLTEQARQHDMDLAARLATERERLA